MFKIYKFMIISEMTSPKKYANFKNNYNQF